MIEKALSEVDIWTNLIVPESGDMSSVHANAILNWQFDEDANHRMAELASRNNKDELTEAERDELQAYVNVGQVIGILQAKARLSLRQSD